MDLRSRLYFGIREVLPAEVLKLRASLAAPGVRLHDTAVLPTVPRIAALLPVSRPPPLCIPHGQPKARLQYLWSAGFWETGASCPTAASRPTSCSPLDQKRLRRLAHECVVLRP